MSATTNLISKCVQQRSPKLRSFFRKKTSARYLFVMNGEYLSETNPSDDYSSVVQLEKRGNTRVQFWN